MIVERSSLGELRLRQRLGDCPAAARARRFSEKCWTRKKDCDRVWSVREKRGARRIDRRREKGVGELGESFENGRR